MRDVVVAAVLVAVAVAVSRWRRLEVERDLVVGAVRGTIQLVLISAIITLLFRRMTWALLLVAVMMAAAAWTSGRRLSGVPRRFHLAAAAIAAGSGLALAVLFGAGVFDLEARYVVVVSGMLVGNCMTATSLAGTRVRDAIVDKRDEIEARLALGVPARDAITPYARPAAAHALIPTIDATKNVGIIFIPGAFVGMILAGSDPSAAAAVQLVVLFMLLGAVAVTAAVASLLVARAFIAPGDRLLPPLPEGEL